MPELSQANAGYSLEAYQAYIAWELQVKKPDVPLVTQLFERAIRQYYSSPEIWSDYGRFIVRQKPACDGLASQLTRVNRRARMQRTPKLPWRSQEERSRTFPGRGRLGPWRSAFSFVALVSEAPKGHIAKMGAVQQEHRHRPAEEVEALCEKAIETGLLDKNVEGLVAWAIGRAGYHRRRLDALGEHWTHPAFRFGNLLICGMSVVAGEDDPEIPSLVKGLEQVLADGIERVRKGPWTRGYYSWPSLTKSSTASKEGDPSFRLEKYLTGFVRLCVMCVTSAATILTSCAGSSKAMTERRARSSSGRRQRNSIDHPQQHGLRPRTSRRALLVFP